MHKASEHLKTLIRSGIIVLAFWITAFSLIGQKLEQEVQAADSLFLGSRFYLNITSDIELSEAVIPDTLSKFAVIKTEALKIKRKAAGLKLTIVPLDTGIYTFPGLLIKATQAFSNTLRTEPFRIEILATRAEKDTTLVEIASTQKLKGELPYFAYYLIAAILVLAMLVALVLLLRKYHKKKIMAEETEAAYQDNRPNWKKALDALNALKQENLPGQGEFIEYHYRLSEIMKLYLETEYQFSANEMTTREIRQHFKKHRIIKAAVHKEIIEWLESCDRVKFAKHVPTEQDCDNSMDWIVNWLKQKSSATTLEVSEEADND